MILLLLNYICIMLQAISYPHLTQSSDTRVLKHMDYRIIKHMIVFFCLNKQKTHKKRTYKSLLNEEGN